jgi:hypothetical protein
VEEMKHLVQMKGDDIVDVILSIKGAVQSYVRYGKFKGASFKANKREGTITAKGVDRSTLEAALDKAISNIPGKKLMYEIEEVLPAKTSTDTKDADETMRIWIEQAQKKWDQKRRAYDREIENLHEQMRKIREEKQSLVKLRKEDARRMADLEKSYDSVSKVVEGLAEERIPDPLTACAQWVGDWSMTGFKLEARLRDAVGDLPQDEISGLLETSVDDILKQAGKEIDGVESLEDLTGIADVVPWEETEDNKRMRADFERASKEMEFFENVESGAVDVPDSIREGLLLNIDVAVNEAVINSYESAKSRYESRTEKADLASTYASRARSVTRLNKLRGSMDMRSLPVAIVCREEGEKWVCETYYPSAESDGLIDSALENVVRKAMRKHCTGKLADETRENVKVCRGNVSGKHKSWKDVSRFQEKLHGDVVERLQESVLGSLGMPVSVSKVMSQRA